MATASDRARALTGALIRLGWRPGVAEAVGHAVLHHPELVAEALKDDGDLAWLFDEAPQEWALKEDRDGNP